MTGPYKGVHVAPGLWSIHLASTLFTINVGHWSQVSSSGHLWSPQPGDAAKKMNVACHSLISSPDTVNFVANLPSLLPDVVTCRHVFIIANSYRRLAGKIIPLPRSSRNLQGDCCLTFMATEFDSTLDLRCQCWNADLKKKMRWSHCSIWEVPLTESPNFPAADRQIRWDLPCVTSRQEFHSLLRCLDFPSSSRLSSRSLGILLLTNGSQDRRIRTNVVKTPDEAAFMLEPQKFLRSHGHRSRSRDLPSVQITGRTP